MTKDESENLISIEWTADGKVSRLVKEETHNVTMSCPPYNLLLDGEVETIFLYDAQGRRVAKYRNALGFDFQIFFSCLSEYSKSVYWDKYGSRSTCYVRDANGEILTIYEGRSTYATEQIVAGLRSHEHLIYGSEGHGKFASKIEAVS